MKGATLELSAIPFRVSLLITVAQYAWLFAISHRLDSEVLATRTGL